jgi:very-short-patch-repair endonuclease
MNSRQGLLIEIPRKVLFDEVRRVAHQLGKPPTMREFDRNSKVGCSKTCLKKFHSWKQFLTQAGLNPDATHRDYVPNEELEQEFRKVYDLLGRAPTSKEFKKYKPKASSTTIARRFGKGSWPEACKALGYLPPPKHLPPGGWNKGKGVDRVRLDEDKLRFMYETDGLSASAIAIQLNCSVRTVLRRMRRAGVKIKKRYYQQQQETAPESLLYAELEQRRIPFMRQQPIDGLYVVDALIPGAKIVIECDGDYWHALPDVQKRDKRKHTYLKSKGYHVLRFLESELQSNAGACVDAVEDEWDRIRPRRKKRNSPKS